jgi:hypothetical protein
MFGAPLRPSAPPPPLPDAPLSPGAAAAAHLHRHLRAGQDTLAISLAALVDGCVEGWRYSRSLLGLIPPNSVLDKFPHAAAALEARVALPPALEWVLAASAEEDTARARAAEEPAARAAAATRAAALARPRPRGTAYAVGFRRRPRRAFARDLVTRPEMVPLYNLLLVWALFAIDVRAQDI